MEVFHMYAIFISNRNNMSMASYVVKVCALPMIIFTGIGMMACSIAILLLSGSHLRIHLKTPRRNTPIDVRFQRWLMIVVFILFASSLGMIHIACTEPGVGKSPVIKKSLLLQIIQHCLGLADGFVPTGALHDASAQAAKLQRLTVDFVLLG